MQAYRPPMAVGAEKEERMRSGTSAVAQARQKAPMMPSFSSG